MDGAKNSRMDRLYRKRWVDYLRSLETVTTLQVALKQAAKESAQQIAEIQELLEADRQGAMINDLGKNETVFYDDPECLYLDRGQLVPPGRTLTQKPIDPRET